MVILCLCLCLCRVSAEGNGYMVQYYIEDDIYASPKTTVHRKLIKMYQDLTGATHKLRTNAYREARKRALPSKVQARLLFSSFHLFILSSFHPLIPPLPSTRICAFDILDPSHWPPRTTAFRRPHSLLLCFFPSLLVGAAPYHVTRGKVRRGSGAIASKEH